MRRAVLLVIFVASGMAGLVFEVALQRSLVRWFGVSAWASALVLAAYMAGLAIGAVALGRAADRAKSALRLYAVLELGVAVWAATSPWLIERAGALFVSVAMDQPVDAVGPRALRFTIALLLTLAPTVLMGGTLPAMARALEQVGERRQDVSLLYTANLLGAGLGALGSAYAVLPGLGLTGTFVLGAVFNALAGGGALVLAARFGAPATAPASAQTMPRTAPPRAATPESAPPLDVPPLAATPKSAPSLAATPEVAPPPATTPEVAPPPDVLPPTATPAPPAQPLDRGLLALAAWSGFSVFVAEVTWTHLLATVIGCSAYAFGLMLGVLLLALAVGGAWLSRLPESKVDWPRVGLVSLVASAALALTIPLWDKAPDLFVIAGAKVKSFEGRELVRALVALEVVGLPAVVLGVVYPLVLRLAARKQALGASLGAVGAANTIGAVGGSLLTGFVLLPVIGSRGILVMLVVGTAAFALWLLPGRRRFAALACVAFAAVLPPWNLAKLASGSNVYFEDSGYASGRLEWAHESITGGFTSVVSNPDDGTRVMLTNGKFQGSNRGETVAQRAYAQVPALLVHQGDRALLVGIGVGGSLAALAAQPYDSVDAVELVQDVTDAARRYFGEVNGGVLDSGRVNVIHADGRNVLLLSSKTYDTVSMQLSSVWFAGAADLYNREYYELVKRRLEPGGVFQQWIQLHHVTPFDLAVMLQTMAAVYQHVGLFVRGHQGIVVCTDGPFEFDYQALAAFSEKYRGTEALAGLPAEALAAQLNGLVLDPAGVRAFVEAEAKKVGRTMDEMVSTDDNLLLEYSTPRGNAMEDATTDAMMQVLAPFRATKVPWKNAPPWAGAELAALDAIERRDATAARAALEKARALGGSLERVEAAVAGLEGG